MKPTMAMVFDVLADRFHCEKGAFYDPDSFVRSSYYYVPEQEAFHQDGITLLSCDEVAQIGNIAPEDFKRLALVCKDSVEEQEPCALVIITSKSIQEVSDVIDEVLLVFKRCIGTIASLAQGGEALERLVYCAHELLNNPIIVQDRAMRVRARTDNDAMDDELWHPLETEAGYDPAKSLPDGFMKFTEFLQEKEGVEFIVAATGKRAATCRTRGHESNYLFISLVQKNRPITDGDIALLLFLRGAIELNLRLNASFENNEIGFEGLLIDAIMGRIPPGVEFINRMKALGITLGNLLRITVAMPRKGRLSDRQAQRLMSDIFNTFSVGRGMQYKDMLVFFSTYDENHKMKNADYRRLEAFLKASNMIAAVGKECPTHASVKESYQTALFALKSGRRAFPQNNLLFFEKCRQFWPYEVCISEGDANLYVHPIIAQLRQYDALHKTSLLEILKLLMENRGNRSLTAKELYVQRNTLHARIREIEMLGKVDLSDQKTIEHISRSIKLEEYGMHEFGSGEQGSYR